MPGDHLHVPRRHRQLEVPGLRGLRPPADEPFGPAERRAPLRRVGDRLVIGGLHHALLIFGCEQREHCRRLRDAPDPFRAAICGAVALVVAVPVGHRGLRVHRRPALRLGLGHQCLVVLLGRLVGVWADDTLTRPVVVAVAPRRRVGRLRADALRIPHRVQLTGVVAAVVALVQPVRAVLVEVLRREQVDRQRLHAVRRSEDRGRATAAASTAGRTRRAPGAPPRPPCPGGGP